jgi:hypothetical protein
LSWFATRSICAGEIRVIRGRKLSGLQDSEVLINLVNPKTALGIAKQLRRLVLGNDALQFAPDKAGTTAILSGSQLIDRLQNIAGHVADR